MIIKKFFLKIKKGGKIAKGVSKPLTGLTKVS